VRNPNGFDLFSYGADGQPAERARMADIGNWEPETAGRN
jgi:hypothetical protein